jgi:hypothetical protein
MNYEKIYNQLCERGKFRSKKDGVYLERHHIIPTFFFKNNKRKLRHSDGIFDGDPDAPNNITLLTPREHFLAHILLCKIWSNTKWYHRCKSSLIFFFTSKEQSKHHRHLIENIIDTKKYQRYREEAIQSISAERTGKMPVKDAKTGEMIGSVLVDHPKVLSGEWVHHSKGKKVSPERAALQREMSRGTNNSNSKYSDEEIIDSYLTCCKKYNMIVNQRFWVEYSRRNNLPYLTSFKEFRFNGGGFSDLIKMVSNCGIRYPQTTDGSDNPFHCKEYRQFLRRNKWD